MNTSNWKSIITFVAAALLISSCGENTHEEKTNTREKENQTAEKKDKVQVYSFPATNIKAKWFRKKDIERDSTNLKLGNLDVNLEVENLNYTASGELPVDSIALTTYEDAFVSGYLSVDARSARKLGTNEEGSLRVKVPEYLNVEEYPSIEYEYEVIGMKGDTLNLVGALTINGKDQQVKAKGIMPEWSDSRITSFYISLKLDALATGLSAIDSDQKVRSDELRIVIKKQENGTNTEQHGTIGL